jgi:hypothetical protein
MPEGNRFGVLPKCASSDDVLRKENLVSKELPTENSSSCVKTNQCRKLKMCCSIKALHFNFSNFC